MFVIIQLMEIISNEQTKPSLSVAAKVKCCGDKWLLVVLLLGL